MKLTLCPLTQREAFAFIRREHRHHEPPRGAKFCIGLLADEALVGVAVETGEILTGTLTPAEAAELEAAIRSLGTKEKVYKALGVIAETCSYAASASGKGVAFALLHAGGLG